MSQVTVVRPVRQRYQGSTNSFLQLGGRNVIFVTLTTM